MVPCHFLPVFEGFTKPKTGVVIDCRVMRKGDNDIMHLAVCFDESDQTVPRVLCFSDSSDKSALVQKGDRVILLLTVQEISGYKSISMAELEIDWDDRLRRMQIIK